MSSKIQNKEVSMKVEMRFAAYLWKHIIGDKNRGVEVKRGIGIT